MQRLRLFQWAAVLTMAIALAPGAASAQEDETLTISGTFNMDYSFGESALNDVAPELLAVYTNGQQHTWILTLYGTTKSHSGWSDFYNDVYSSSTEIHATSFDFEFSGPDAATLNGFVSDHLAGGDVEVTLENVTNFDSSWAYGVMHVHVYGNDGMYFHSELNINLGSDSRLDTDFPTDANFFPAVGPEPFSTETDYTVLGHSDPLAGYAGIGSVGGLVTFAGNVGQSPPPPPPPPPLPMLAIEDASVPEGNRGTTRLDLTVMLSREPDNVVTVDYATVDGTARKKSDYTAKSGTLTFQPGQSEATISIAIKADRKREPHEIFYVELFNADGAKIVDGVATATIMNDD